MNVPRHWCRVRVDLAGREDPRGPAIAFGWSDVDAAAAHRHGTARARAVAEALRARSPRQPVSLRRCDEYYPLERPLLEPVVEWLEHGGARVGVITRNAYGAHVLNTPRAMFVDLDLPYVPPPARGMAAWLGGVLFGRPEAPAPPDVPSRVAAVLAANPGVGMRLYRTAAGWRGLVTTHVFEPASAASLALLGALGADPLYVQLTRAQQCFRARLTPKPWRLGLHGPQAHWFPFDDDPDRRARFEAWDRAYDEARAGWSVCGEPVRIGPDEVLDEIAPVVAVHERCCVPGAPLA